MTEEINYSYEGGIYAELIQNRNFRDNEKNPVHWALVQDSGAAAAMSLDESQPIPDTALARCLKLEVSHAAPDQRAGIANDGYWGIPVKPDTTYRVSFYAKADNPASGPLRVSIEDPSGKTSYASGTVPAITDKWLKYNLEIKTQGDIQPTANARFVISVDKPGTYWFNLVSVFPPTFGDRPNGNRPDLMKMLGDMNATFLRLPGGNFLEGDTIADRFPWKKTIGPLEQRPGHRGCWRYGANDGLGLLEFLEWCEDIHIEPVLAVYAGYSLKGEHVDAGPKLQPFVDDALDEIEYVTGDVSTKWGAERAKDGHPAPFSLHYVEIGNEDGFDKSKSYDARYAQFYDAIKGKYPTLQCISTTGGKDPLGKRIAITLRQPDAIDEHYYRKAYEMEMDATHYDHYDRKGPKIFVGEWATREGQPTTNLNAALGDAAWMTGMERNSDIVILASYAPLLVNVNRGGMQWPSDLIGYNVLGCYGSPSYYAQKMFNTHLGDVVINCQGQDIPTQAFQLPGPKAKPGEPPPVAPPPIQLPSLFYVATRNTATGTVYLKVVNIASQAQTLQIHLKGVNSVAPEGKLIVLSSDSPANTNTLQDPLKIVPKETVVGNLSTSFPQTFAPYSINVLQIETK